MRLKLVVIVCFVLVGLPTAAPTGAPQTHPASAQRALCSSGYVDAVIGGEHKCLHGGEFCAARYEADYERYGFACVGGRLQSYSGAPTASTATAPASGVYHPAARTKASRCRARGALPDPACTPGAVFANASTAQICVSGY